MFLCNQGSFLLFFLVHDGQAHLTQRVEVYLVAMLSDEALVNQFVSIFLGYYGLPWRLLAPNTSLLATDDILQVHYRRFGRLICLGSAD